MYNFKSQLKSFLNDEEGLTAVEYAIAGSLVAGAVVLAFTDLGTAAGEKVDCLGDVVANRSSARTTGCN